VGGLATSDAAAHHRVYRAVAALPPEALARLGPSPASGGGDGSPFDLRVIDELLSAGEPAHAATLGEISLADRVRRLGRAHPETVAAAGRLLDANRQLDERALSELLERNERLIEAVGIALGADHTSARSAAVNLSRLRSLWAQHRQFGGSGR
jgi:hypothetical protein